MGRLREKDPLGMAGGKVTYDSTRVRFLQEMTARHPCLFVWKHFERSLQGQGDVDAAAPVGELGAIRADAIVIAGETLSATHVILCDHVADKSLHFFVQRDRLSQLFELDVCSQPSRGLAPWANPHLMLPLTMLGADGIRRLRPGAEAVVSLVYHGLSAGGAPRLGGQEFRLVDRGLADDFRGAAHACESLPPLPARSPLLELVTKLSHGRWDRTLAQKAHLGFVISCGAHPKFTVRRCAFRFRLAAGQECVMSRLARREGRRVPPSGLAHLLRSAQEGGHAVIEL